MIARRLIFVVSAAAIAIPAAALEGRVVLPGGVPAAGATVSLVGRPGSARAGADGRFVLLPDPVPPFEVLVVLRTGQALSPVRVQSLPASGLLLIEPVPVLTESIRVTSGATPHIEAPPASGVALITRTDLAERHALRLTDALENIPGVGRLEEGHSAVPSIRGLARGRTLILIDGARVTAERRAGPSATFLDPFFLETVEVARGPGSVAYGSDAFGGVIDARTPLPDDGAGARTRVQATLAAGAPEQSAGVAWSRGFTRGGLLFQARARNFDDYRAPDGDVPDSSARDGGALLRGSVAAGPGRLLFGWQADSARDIGKPSSRYPDVRAFYPREDSGRFTLGWEVAPDGPFNRAAVEGFFGSYRLITDRERSATAGDPRTLSRADIEANDYGLRASAQRLVGAGRMEFGLDMHGRFGLEAVDTVQTYDALGAVTSRTIDPSVENARRDDTGLFVTGEAPLGSRLTATGGIRLQEVQTENHGGFAGDQTTRHDAFAGHAALTARIAPGWSAVLQLARGFREPTLSDRYFRGTTGRGTVTGNPDLDPEHSLQADLALRFSPLPRLRGAFYAYRYRIDDLVERYEPAPDEFTFRNRGGALIRGVEIELETETRGGWALAFGGQISRGEALDDGAPLADIPPAGGFVMLRRTVARRLDLTARLAGHLRDRRPGPTEIETPGHAIVDLGAGWRLRTGLDLRLLVRNVLDRSYPGSPDEAAVPAPGRSAAVTIGGRF